ncbi:TPA: hypothetical protein ACH3X2_000380 [Trebouxia sp. C0005]|nr:MAG: hypothetical protein FRX49_09043 [Trebouxia sp. A1-2]
MDCGRIQCFLIATTTGSVVYERFYLRFTDVEKADIRAAFQRASEFLITGASDESEFADRYKAGSIALRLEGDIVFYALGTGEYDELNLAETIRAISLGLRDTLKKPTEAALFDNYGRLCMVVDEVINEGILEAVDRDAIQRGMKMKLAGE